MNKIFLSTFSIKFIIIVAVSVLSFSFYSCSGCSRSGIRHKQKKRLEALNGNTSYLQQKHSQKINISKEKKNTSEINRKKKDALSILYKKYSPSVFIVFTFDRNYNKYQGTGFFISKNGIAISNYHLFEGTYKDLDYIKTIDGRKLKIDNVLSKSKEDDYFIFKVNLEGYKISNPIPIANKLPEIGDDVFAIGNPIGLENTLSKGIVSGFRQNKHLIQTTTEITHGSSGGPLLNMNGEVIGITSSGFGTADLNFAVNIKLLPLQRLK